MSDAAHTIRTMTSASFTASALPGEESQSKATLGKRRHCYEQGRNGRHPSGSKCNTNNVKKSCHKIQLELHSTLFYRSTGVMTHRHVKLFSFKSLQSQFCVKCKEPRIRIKYRKRFYCMHTRANGTCFGLETSSADLKSWTVLSSSFSKTFLFLVFICSSCT